ncbi:hypothetical protein RM392_001150 [Enterobacter cloacae]|uniref:hypothetical protein n=1 Tax=Enterobacter cloacae complex TaxID=354276 RepID=UPI001FF48316|nr:hypothetical protein [Enterobacter cloacae]ELE9704011.1 hypothetical protein [Enterobacter cloacae]MCK1073047.1 hypothetical protein [Enterobacter cloacae subsp. cloacae]MCZ9583100.1 hypothetical protein [Enterobacter cloacae]HAS1221333.1 hypothetical protein [Enterobacter cloacae]
MIQTFVSRPTWAPPVIEEKLKGFYHLLEDNGFKANTIGKSQAPLRSPFEDVKRLMMKCQCTIVLGLPQIFMHSGSVKHVPIEANLNLPTEWNHIEATMSLMLDLPTLMMIHKSVSTRGIFERGAANVFIYEFDSLSPDWLEKVRPTLNSLKQAV